MTDDTTDSASEQPKEISETDREQMRDKLVECMVALGDYAKQGQMIRNLCSVGGTLEDLHSLWRYALTFKAPTGIMATWLQNPDKLKLMLPDVRKNHQAASQHVNESDRQWENQDRRRFHFENGGTEEEWRTIQLALQCYSMSMDGYTNDQIREQLKAYGEVMNCDDVALNALIEKGRDSV